MQTEEPPATASDTLENPGNGETVLVFPVTVAQRRFWMLDQLKPGNPALNFPLSARLQGRIDRPALERTMNEILARHEILRTSFRTMDGEVVQVIHPRQTLTLDWHDISTLPENEREAVVDQLRREEAVRPFSLSAGPLLRAGLIKVKDEDFVLTLNMHHIACDGWSNGVLIPEIARIYSALVSGQSLPPELPLQFADFAHWQNEWLESPEAAQQRDFWHTQLKGVLPTLNLPTDRPRRAGRTHPGTIRTLLLPKSLSEPLKTFCTREDATLFMLILAAYGLILHRYTGKTDIIIGSPAANRNQTDLEGLIGLFTNPLLMRLDFSGNPSLRTVLARTRKLSLEAFAHQSYPFETLAGEIEIDPHRSGVQWLQAYFVFQKAFMLPQQLPEATLIPLRSLSPGSMFEWLLGVVERAEGVRLQLEYNTDLFEHATVDRMLNHFLRTLEMFLANPELPAGQLPLMTPAEVGEQRTWNGAELKTPEPSNALALFAAQARKTPEAPAVFDGKCQLGYAQLDKTANRLAHFLKSNGVRPGTRVGLALEIHSASFVECILGILKTGGCCVFIDPSWDARQLRNYAKTAQIEILIQTSALPDSIQGLSLINLEESKKVILGQSSADLTAPVNPNAAAWVRFSTGRSGTPKAAVISHQGLVQSALARAERFEIAATDRVSGSLDEIFPALLSGACWVAPQPDVEFEPDNWPAWAKAAHITVAALPTARWHEVVRLWPEPTKGSPENLRLVIAHGDHLSPAAAATWQKLTQGRIRLLSGYGLAEANGNIAYSDSHGTGEWAPRAFIGKPLANTCLYVLDSNLQPVPSGIPGDIYVGGSSLASSLASGEQAGTEHFIVNPFSSQTGDRLLRTGDRGRFVSGKGLELTGRTDELEKTHNFRLELCEIRQILYEHPGIWSVILEPRTDTEKSLVVHVQCAHGQTLSSDEILSFMKGRLPAYMVADSVCIWDEFPLAAKGTVDQKALAGRNLESQAASQNGTKSLSSIENSLLALWKDVLKVKKVGIHDNFFDLGGDSMAAATLQTRIEKHLGKRVPLATFFQAATVEQQARRLSESTNGTEPGLDSRVLTFKTAAMGNPLFLFHYINSSKLLAARFPASRAIHCIDSPFEDEFSVWEQSGKVTLTMTQLAERCAEIVRNVQPSGPYNLSGFCYGGVVAFAVAQCLMAQGQKVSFVGLLDAFYPPGIKPAAWPWLRRVMFHSQKVRKLGLPYMARKLRERRNIARERNANKANPQLSHKKPEPTDAEKTHLRRIAFMREIISAYRSEPYPGAVALFRAVSDPHPFDFDFAANGWDAVVQGGIKFEDFECSHLDLSEVPYVGDLAQRIENHLSAFENQNTKGQMSI